MSHYQDRKIGFAKVSDVQNFQVVSVSDDETRLTGSTSGWTLIFSVIFLPF